MVLDPQSMHRMRADPFQADTPLPQGMQIPNELQRPAQPMQNNIRGLIQRLRGMNPTPAEPAPGEAAPFAPPPPPMRSVLKR
jgi:hypothetical protein